MSEILGSAVDTIQVESGAGADLVAARGCMCCAIELHASGTLEYVTAKDVTRSLTGLPAGIKFLRAKSITTTTNVKVTCYFNERVL